MLKKWMGLGLASLLIGGHLATAPLSDAASPILKASEHCVAYKTKKTVALVRRAEVVGKSCSVTVKAVKDSSGKFGAEISFPISSMDSKEKDRDKEVLKILKASVQPNLIFKTDFLSEAQWQAMMKKGSGPVKGNLYIGKKPHSLTAVAKVKKSGANLVVSGQIVTKFTTLGITPPVVGPGGSIAKTDDYLELHFNFLSSKVANKSVVPGL